MSTREVQRFISLIQDMGVSAIVFTLIPDSYPEDRREHHQDLIGRLQNAGIRVVPQKHCHERYAVIDDALVWYGSMNLLSNERADDNLMRLVSPAVAEKLLEVSMKG